MQQSNKEFVLSDYEAQNKVKPATYIQHEASNSNNLSHTMPCEQGGMPMLDFAQAMKSDAELQTQMLGLLSDRLDWLVHINDQRKVNNQTISIAMFATTLTDNLWIQKESLLCFEGTRSPIAASKYVQRILKYGRVSECCFLVAVVYIERLKLAGHAVRLSSTSLQRLLAVAVMVAAKFLDEPYYSNKWW